MLVERKHYFRCYSGVLMYSSGDNLGAGLEGDIGSGATSEPPPNIYLPTGPNIRSEWVAEKMETSFDHQNNLYIVWCLVTTTLEPGDQGYTAEMVRTPPVIPAQRITATLELLTHEKVEPEAIQEWLTARLRDCSLGYLTLRELREETTPTRWTHLARDDEQPQPQSLPNGSETPAPGTSETSDG